MFLDYTHRHRISSIGFVHDLDESGQSGRENRKEGRISERRFTGEGIEEIRRKQENTKRLS